MDFSNFFNELIYILPSVIIALSVHEFAHAYVSYRLGDISQKERGRLTLNPLKHLDPFGTLCLIFFKFGWAKPVQVDPYFFRNKDVYKRQVWWIGKTKQYPGIYGTARYRWSIDWWCQLKGRQLHRNHRKNKIMQN